MSSFQLNSEFVVGVDGCRAGWLAAQYHPNQKNIELQIHRTFADVISHYPGNVLIAVDIPIGLREDGYPRTCDTCVRKLLGVRRNSVFPAPSRQLLQIKEYDTANSRSRELFDRGLSRQSFAIMRKIDEVNELMDPQLQERILEVHPELTFWSFRKTPMSNSKKKREGYEERRKLLSAGLGVELPDSYNWRKADLAGFKGAQRDDLLDAVAAAYTAGRAVHGQIGFVPATEERDSHDVLMRINY
jgi:predicted RNase H-like nuclease